MLLQAEEENIFTHSHWETLGRVGLTKNRAFQKHFEQILKKHMCK